MVLTDYTGMITGGTGGCAQGSSAGSNTPCPKVSNTQLEMEDEPGAPEFDDTAAKARQQQESIATTDIERSASVRGELDGRIIVGQVEVNAGGEKTVTVRRRKGPVQAGVQKGPDGVITQLRVDVVPELVTVTVDSAERVELSTPVAAVRSDGLITVNPIRLGPATVAVRVNPVRWFDGFARGVNALAQSFGAEQWSQFINHGTVSHDQYILNGGPP